jgi:hypothetical protein
VVVWIEDGDVIDAYISDDVALKDEFELREVHSAVKSYNPEEEICIVLVRDNEIATLVGEVG